MDSYYYPKRNPDLTEAVTIVDYDSYSVQWIGENGAWHSNGMTYSEWEKVLEAAGQKADIWNTVRILRNHHRSLVVMAWGDTAEATEPE